MPTSPLVTIRAISDGIALDVRVIPRAGRAGIAGTRDGALLVRLNAPPVEGAANAELIEIIASVLGVSKRQITIAAGEHARRKSLKITGIELAEVEARLAAATR